MHIGYRYGKTVVWMHEDHVETELPDGTRVKAVPLEGAEHVQRAHMLGYGGDLWAMTRDHDRLHASLAHMLGLKESPALRASASNQAGTPLTANEEAAVLAIQVFLNACRAQGLATKL